MSRRSLNILGILILMAITSIVSIFAYILIIGGSGEASRPISAPTLSAATATPNALATEVAQLSAEVERLTSENATLTAGQAAAAENAATEATPEVAAEATAETTPEATVAAVEATPEVAAAAAPVVFRIVPDESEVRFILTEDLRGQFTTVIGRTDQVAGDILVDFAAPANSRVGEIVINARTLLTDNEFRNRAIRSEILESSKPEYEFSQFTPTAVTGLPDSVSVGDEFTFQIAGDLKVRDITNPVTFDVTATLTSENRLEGTAKTTVTRAEYDLQIPSVPSVANVSDEVQLEIDFVATRVQQ
jgi:polyisoprenoid-binding protein YceI